MAEPIATTTTSTAAVGVLALLIGAFGPAVADVMLVVAAALAGSFISLCGAKKQTAIQSLGFVLLGVTVALLLSWALQSSVAGMIPQIPRIYVPSLIALGVGFMSNQLPGLFSAITEKIKSHLIPAKKN